MAAAAGGAEAGEGVGVVRDEARIGGAAAGGVVFGHFGEAEVAIDNGCDRELTFAPSRWRVGPGVFEVIADVSEIPARGSARLRLRATPIAAGTTEAVLFVETLGDPIDRRPLTLVVRATD